MVQLMWSEEKISNTCLWSEPETAAEKRPMKFEEDFPIHKRWKSLSTNESPLGLRLKKSPSLLDLIEKRLSQTNKKNVTSSPIDKLKASNFPALLLRIGQWKYVSQHEGDLVAKCYFAKHKLVWEVLDGGLKNKMEIQWADIVALKANCPDDGPSTLTIMLGKPPLFFRETDPQPRKHTLWQPTSDFTNGEATTYRQHYLQCAQGVLNKHYEKLIQCDTRLNYLSQKQDTTVLDLPFEDLGNHQPQTSNSPDWGFDFTKHTHSGVHLNGFEEYGNNCLEQPRVQRSTMSVSDFVNHIGHCISEPNSARILPLLENVKAGGNISQHDGNDYFTPAGCNLPQGWDENFNDLLHQLPRIASPQRLFFDISEDGEILNH